VGRALDCRRDQGFAEGSRLAAEVAERLGRNAEAARHLEQVARLTPADTAILARIEELARRPAADTEPPPDATLPPALALLSDTSIATPSRERVQGIIDRFFVEKGFGFVQYGEGRSIFFHVTQCEGPARSGPRRARELRRRPQPEEGEAAGRGGQIRRSLTRDKSCRDRQSRRGKTNATDRPS
jgi:hypothetical protein